MVRLLSRQRRHSLNLSFHREGICLYGKRESHSLLYKSGVCLSPYGSERRHNMFPHLLPPHPLPPIIFVEKGYTHPHPR